MRLYFIQAIANIRENPLASFLVILGTALSVAMMLVLILVFQIKTSSFAPVSERHRLLYLEKIEGLDEKGNGYIGGGAMGYRIVKDCFYPMSSPEKTTAVSANTYSKRTAVSGTKTIRECDIRFVDASFWSVFDFRFINGKPFTEASFNSALPVAVISDRVAREFFGTTEIAGKTLQLDYVDYAVQGVVVSVSKAVEEAYGEIWIPYSVSRDIMTGDFVEGIGGQLQVFFLAKSPADFDKIRKETQSRIESFNSGQERYKANIWKQPINSIQRMFYFVQGDRVHGNASGMLMLAALFLLLPIFNLLGIMISQNQKRRPEIGLRKAFGATTSRIVGQRLTENFIITLMGGVIGLFLSILFFFIAKDGLLERTDVTLQPGMILKPAFFLTTLVVCMLINLLSAAIPAWKTARSQVTDSLNANI
ncbi:MAG: ABC transporter permease [Tannerella sp.]|jgi:putative ABC transport system permease protein|nr:ABC transporter permease [Tannerella sp.]